MNNSSIKIYHNPRCSKSRSALQLLQEHGIEPKIVEYLKHPPTASALKQLLSLLQVPVEELVRQQESAFQELKLDNNTLNADDWLHLLQQHPTLLQRPIVASDTQAVIARPPERVLEIIKPDSA